MTSTISAVEFHEITGFRPTGGRSTSFNFASLSADGLTVAGSSNSQSPFLWTAAGGIVHLNDLPGGEELRTVADVSWDASAVLAKNSSGEWVIWHADSSAPTVLSGFSQVSKLSSDASTVVGYTGATDNRRIAARWREEDGLTQLPHTLRSDSVALAVSGDGELIGGAWGGSRGAALRGFLWRDGEADVSLLDPIDMAHPIFGVNAVSPNGRHLLAYSENPVFGFNEAVILRDGFAPVHLETGGEYYASIAKAISNKGDRVAGVLTFHLRGDIPFIWNPESGVRELQDVLVNDYGLADELSDWTLRDIRGMSADGKTFLLVASDPTGVGSASTFRLAVVTVPEPPTVVLSLVLGLIPLLVKCRGYSRRRAASRVR